MSSLRDFRIYYYGATNVLSLRDYKYTFFVYQYVVSTGLCFYSYRVINIMSLRDCKCTFIVFINILTILEFGFVVIVFKHVAPTGATNIMSLRD